MSRKQQRKLTRQEQRQRLEPVRFYFGYGSNLSHAQMKIRAPEAVPFKPLYLPNGRLVFRGVADVEHHEGSAVPGALYRITPRCERALDFYEGVYNGIYEKKYLVIRIKSESNNPVQVLYYKMRDRGIMPPTEEYIERIAQGYRDFGLDLAYLDEALDHSWKEKRLTKFLRQRYEARGKPPLAQPFFDESDQPENFDANSCNATALGLVKG